PAAATMAVARATSYAFAQTPQGQTAPRPVRPATPAPVLDPAAQLVQRIVRVKGGLTALKRIRTVVADSETTFRMEQGPLLSLTRTYVAYPDKFRVDAKVS